MIFTLFFSALHSIVPSFPDSSNAVSPAPSWPLKPADSNVVHVTQSTTSPSDTQQYGAMDFSLWKHIGKEFMVKSNLNNWIACKPVSGDLTEMKEGALECRIIKNISHTGCSILPLILNLYVTECGPYTKAPNRPTSNYYYFDGCTSTHFPTHDPCGDNSYLNSPDVSQGRGQIWIRKL